MPGELPISTVFDPRVVDGILETAANALSIQLSLGTEWEHDDDWRSDIVWGLNTINPVAGFKNLYLHGQWTQDTSGAVAVRQDQNRRKRLRTMFIHDFRRIFDERLSRSPQEARDYLALLVRNTQRAWAAISEQFEEARRANNDICRALNDALDRTYRIRTAASVAFMVVSCLPIAGGAAAGATAGSLTLAASSGAWWCVALKVMGTGMIYGFLTEMAFDPNQVRRSSAAAYHVGEAGEAAVVGGGATAVQASVERIRLREAAAIASARNQEAARVAVRNTVREAHAAARGLRAPPRMMSNEVQRQVARRVSEHAERNLARQARWVSRSGSVVFIGIGLVMMSDEIKQAYRGLTADIDRTR